MSVGSSLDPKDPLILDKVASKYHAIVVGEDNNIKLIFLACIAKDLPRKFRIHAIIYGESSSGKSYLLRNITRPFQEYIIDYTDFTQAWLRRQNRSMDGMIFLLEQLQHEDNQGQVSIEDMKFLLSEGRIRMGLVEIDDNNRRRPTCYECEGIPAFLTTSTKVNIDLETQNRTLLLSIDESQEQSKRIVKHILNDYAKPDYLKGNDDITKDLRSLVEIYRNYAKDVVDIVLPFAPKLESVIPIKDVKIRRDLSKLLNLACIIAFIHAPIRKAIIRKDKGHYIDHNSHGFVEKEVEKKIIIGELDDFKEALSIAGKTFFQTIHNLTEKAVRVYNIAKEIEERPSSDGIRAKQITKESEFKIVRTVRDMLSSLERAGFLVHERVGRENVYHTTGKMFTQFDPLSIEFTEDEFQAWLKDTFPEEVDLRMPSVVSFNEEKNNLGYNDKKEERKTAI